MKVKAKCNIKYGSRWITGGEVFDIPKNVYGLLKDMVTVVEYDEVAEEVPDEAPAEEEEEPEAAAPEEVEEPVPDPAPAKAQAPKKTGGARPRRTTTSTK